MSVVVVVLANVNQHVIVAVVVIVSVKMTEKQKITKEMSFSEIMEKNPKASKVLLEKGMHCIGCPMAQMESLEEGCMSHGLNPDEVVEELNK